MSDPYPIACSLGICDGFNLLLPENLIADVVSTMTISHQQEGQPWSLGELNWRGQQVKAVSIEQLITKKAPRIRGSHIAIFHGTSDSERLPFYAVPLQAIPHNFKLVRESDLADRSDDLELAYCQAKVRARGVAAIIPDLEGIEARLLSS